MLLKIGSILWKILPRGKIHVTSHLESVLFLPLLESIADDYFNMENFIEK